MTLSAISVDLDALPHYSRIYGLNELSLDDRALRLVADVAIPRFLELFADAGVPATFFAIGSEADPILARAHAAGVEIASHGFSHDYEMSRWPLGRISADLALAHEALTKACGAEPRGFRAPGYSLSPAILQALAARGLRVRLVGVSRGAVLPAQGVGDGRALGAGPALARDSRFAPRAASRR